MVDYRDPAAFTVTRLPAVVAARALIADMAGALPIVGVRDGAPIVPTPSLLVRPDTVTAGMTRRRFVHRAAMSLTGWGKLYFGVLRWGFDSWPLQLEVLKPDTVTPDYTADGILEGWTVDGYPVEPSAVTYVPLWELDLTGDARSPIAECQQAFDDLAVLWMYATGFWLEGGKPPYALRYPGRLRSGQALEALELWITARAEHRPGLLSGGWELQDLPIPSADDALLLEGLRYIDATVCRVFGITPTLLNTYVETGSLTYNNAQDELRRWLNLSLYPTWLARIEDAFTLNMPHGQQAMFDTTSLGALGLERPGADEGRATTAPLPPAPSPPAVAVNGNGG